MELDRKPEEDGAATTGTAAVADGQAASAPVGSGEVKIEGIVAEGDKTTSSSAVVGIKRDRREEESSADGGQQPGEGQGQEGKEPGPSKKQRKKEQRQQKKGQKFYYTKWQDRNQEAAAQAAADASGSEPAADGSTSSSSTSRPAKEGGEKYPKKKVALIIGYIGTGYKGMQKNPGVRTIEEDLEKAIFEAGGIIQENLGVLQKVQWQRCARTDKGVHAVAQVISLKLILVDNVLEKINEHLPPSIRLFAIIKVAGSFNAKLSCDSRIYEYLLPTFVFAPSKRSGLDEDGFVFDENMKAKVNSTLGCYLGTHNFHNFTAKLEAKEASAHRFIKSFTCSDPFKLGDVEYVRLEVVGASFLLHQIRKMIGLAVAIIRDNVEARPLMEAAFSRRKLLLPMAPGLGLLLQKCNFAGYDKRFAKSHESMSLSTYQEAFKNFKVEKIYPEIVRLDGEKQEFRRWLSVLDDYPVDYEMFLDPTREAVHLPHKPNKPPKTSEGSDGQSVTTTAVEDIEE